MMSDDQTRPIAMSRARRGCGLIGLLALCGLVFTCGLCITVYLLVPPASLDVMLLGLDARPGEGTMTRADTIMIAGIQPGQLRVSMLSIPRDLYFSAGEYGEERINAIHMLGEMETPQRGVSLMQTSLGAALGVRIDRYVRVDFRAFVALVDAVGGVTIGIERPIDDYAYPAEDGGTMLVHFDAGWQALDGERALQYARTRHGDDDYRRAERQQQVLTALLGKLIQPQHWAATLNVWGEYVDTDLSLWDAVAIGPTLVFSGGRFDRLVIDRSYINATVEGNPTANAAALAGWIDPRFD
jgi:LCP family protein required for cell wall assembly